MLCLYIDNFNCLAISHKFCSMLNTLNEIAFQKEGEHFMTNIVYGTKTVKININKT